MDSQKMARQTANLPLPQEIKVNVTIAYSYSTESIAINDMPATLSETGVIVLNDLLEELKRHVQVEEFSISYYDNELSTYIFCGVFPFSGLVTIPLSPESNNLKLKFRPIIKKENTLRMELAEEDTENVEEANQNNHINVKSKRAKERKIGYIIKKVYMWRKLYNGFLDEKGNFVRLTLEEAADKVGISKKSLDDYLIQLRIGKLHGFSFNEHKNDKVGVLRAFVKKNKNIEDMKTSHQASHS